MERALNLVKTDFTEVEKRVFPRFPYCFLTFKGEGKMTFEVKDISYTGMQLSLKDGAHNYQADQEITGDIHWRGKTMEAKGVVRWINGSRLGVAFTEDSAFQEEIKSFLSVDNIVESMRPLHNSQMDLELPSNLKYWLRTDGPVELFVWQHNDGELARFQLVMLENFVEWEDGRGLKTGRVLTKRDLDTPLVTEDEFVFQMDEGVLDHKVDFGMEIIAKLPPHYLPEHTKDFLKLKLSH